MLDTTVISMVNFPNKNSNNKIYKKEKYNPGISLPTSIVLEIAGGKWLISSMLLRRATQEMLACLGLSICIKVISPKIKAGIILRRASPTKHALSGCQLQELEEACQLCQREGGGKKISYFVKDRNALRMGRESKMLGRTS